MMIDITKEFYGITRVPRKLKKKIKKQIYGGVKCKLRPVDLVSGLFIYKYMQYPIRWKYVSPTKYTDHGDGYESVSATVYL